MSDEQPKPKKSNGAVKSAFKWIISPGFGRPTSPNPFKFQGLAGRGLVLNPLSQISKEKKRKKEIDEVINGVDSDPLVRDRYVFEAYKYLNSQTELSLLAMHRVLAVSAIRTFVLTLFCGAGIIWLYMHLLGSNTLTSKIFNVLPIFFIVSILIPVTILFLTGARLMFNAWCIRQQRHGSFDALLLYVSSPGQWFPPLRLLKLPKVSRLPKNLRDFSYLDQFKADAPKPEDGAL